MSTQSSPLRPSRPSGWRDHVPSLLLSFAASALAVVGAVGWAMRTDSAWVTAGAVALTLVLTASLLRQLLGVAGEPARLPVHPQAAWGMSAVAAAALLVPLGLPSIIHPGVTGGPSPQGTVRSFLGAVVDGDGQGACSFVSVRARLDLQGRSSGGPTCESYFGGAALQLGGRAIVRDSQLDGLHYAVRPSGPDRLVTVSGYGGSLRFRLHPATNAERDAFDAPATPWRIDSNPTQLEGRT